MIVTFILLLGILSLYIIHIIRCYSFFKNLGIDGPSPTFFFGNVADFARTQRISISIRNWTKQFGRIYGYFEGHTPVLVISDPDILDKIFLKCFSKFHSRRQFPLEDRSKTAGVHLFSATGNDWRRQRHIMNPTFSAKKIKCMLPIINDCLTNFVNKLNEYTEKDIDIFKLYKSLTMDLIWRCCFGIKTDMLNNPNDPYLVRSQQVFAKENSTYITAILGVFIPELQPCWLFIHSWMNKIKAKLRSLLPMGDKIIDDDPSEWLKNNVNYFIEKALDNRDEKDLLHLMLDATQMKSNKTNIEDRGLTLDEIKQNIYLFMVAGYETASTALAYITYVLVTHPDEQRKLRELIDLNCSDENILDYNVIDKMEYLDWFIRETLRMYPVTPIVINRQCSEEIHLPGLGSIAPGTKLTLDMYSLHYDEDLWGPIDTNIFYPDRFASKRHQLAWVAFGAGPRNCIGMKFALIELKLAVIRLLKEYELRPPSASPNNLELTELVTISPKELKIRLEKRTK